jgi:hypothetical protein
MKKISRRKNKVFNFQNAFFFGPLLLSNLITFLKLKPLLLRTMHPFSLRAFQRDQEHKSEASKFGGSHKYKTKQTNYVPS